MQINKLIVRSFRKIRQKTLTMVAWRTIHLRQLSRLPTAKLTPGYAKWLGGRRLTHSVPQALKRDGYRCVVTRAYDIKARRANQVDMPQIPLGERRGAYTKCCQILLQEPVLRGAVQRRAGAQVSRPLSPVSETDTSSGLVGQVFVCCHHPEHLWRNHIRRTQPIELLAASERDDDGTQLPHRIQYA